LTEQIADVGRGISLAYERIGDAGAEPLVLVAGLGQQLHSWPDAFCAHLAGRGYEVIRFDNRDAGRSTHPRFRPPSLPGMLAGRFPAQQYDLTDMAADTAGLLDALAIDSAHVVGVSMGGFIGQLLAIHHPRRVRSLASIMSSTGARDVGGMRPEMGPLLMTPPPAQRHAYIESRLEVARRLAGTRLRTDEARLGASIARAYDRCFDPRAAARQFQAILSAPDRTAALGALRVPVVVIHGTDDPLIDVSGGEATARAIPGARLVLIPGMGHDLPDEAWDRLISAIGANAARAA